MGVKIRKGSISLYGNDGNPITIDMFDNFRSGTGSSYDDTELRRMITTELAKKSDKGHTHTSNEITDLSSAIYSTAANAAQDKIDIMFGTPILTTNNVQVSSTSMPAHVSVPYYDSSQYYFVGWINVVSVGFVGSPYITSNGDIYDANNVSGKYYNATALFARIIYSDEIPDIDDEDPPELFPKT